MKFKIIHTTEYLFNSEIFLEPHVLRFRPRITPYVNVIDFSLTILSAPEGNKIMEDEENNVVDFCWFSGMTESLKIRAQSVLETKEFNPFNFILFPETFNQIPFYYSLQQQKLLFSSLEKQILAEDLIDYRNRVLKAANSDTIAYLTQLTYQIHQDFSVEYREDGPPLAPNTTFQLKKGSCRDLAWMQISLLREQGIAARFVSGYYYFDMDAPQYELHAWLDVFLPGIGWLGLDPSHGILTGNTHFPLASSAISENTMPVSGGIRGSASSQLITALSIEKM
ncbi:MAG: transglutaminase family protein [Cellulophaga sp.]|nr:transglutaminase family protein [Cellulophaga sp.]